MSADEVARELTQLCKDGRFDEAGERFWAEDAVSMEAAGPDPVARGKAALKAKGEWWGANHEVHRFDVEGPYVNGDQFVVRYSLDVTQKASGQRITMDEVGLYTVRDGKVVEERFFYGTSGAG